MKLYIYFRPETYHKKITFGKFWNLVHFESALDFTKKQTVFIAISPLILSSRSPREDARGHMFPQNFASLRIPYRRFGSKVCKKFNFPCVNFRNR